MIKHDEDFDCEFRPACRGDYDSLHELLQTGWMEIYTPHVSAASVARFIAEDAVGDHLNEFLATMEVALVGGLIVGVVNCFEQFITALFVAPGFRGNGIGSALMHNAELSGGRYLEASAFNTDCIRFYLCRGWSKSSETREEWFGTSLPAFVFSKV